MIIKAADVLQHDYDAISGLAEKTREPIYITKDGEGDMVVMSIDAFERRERKLAMRAAVLQAEQERIDDERTLSIEDARRKLRMRVNAI